MSEANDPAGVSEANDPAGVSEDSGVSETVTEDPKAHEAHIQIVKGHPTAEEVAALLAVLAGASGPAPQPREQEQNLWGHPVDRLRYTTFSWQRVTLLERTHMRK